MLFFRQLFVLLRKQLLLKRRSPVEWALEFLIPLAFIGIMAALFFAPAFATKLSPDASFIDQATAVMPFSMLPHRLAFLAQRLGVVCEAPAPAALCDKFVAHMAALHPAFNFSADIAANPALAQAMQPLTSQLPIPVVPGFADVVQRFPSLAALEACKFRREPTRAHLNLHPPPKKQTSTRTLPSPKPYQTDVTAPDYDTAWERDSAANPKVWGAIVFTSESDYALRLNASATPPTDGARVNVLQRFSDVPGVVGRYTAAALDSRGPPFLLEKPGLVTGQPYPGFLTLQREVDRFLIQRAWNAGGGAGPLNVTDTRGADTHSAQALVTTFFSMLFKTMPLDGTKQLAIGAALKAGLFSPVGAAARQPLLDAAKRWTASEALPPQDVTIVPFPVASYTTNPFYGLVLTILSLLLVIAYVVPTSRLIRGIVQEKESKMREGMRMMGLGDAALFGAHLLWYALAYHLPLSLLIAAITNASFFPRAGFGYIFLLFWLFGVASTALMFLLSSFFSQAKTATAFGSLVFIACFFPTFSFSETTLFATKRTASLLCPTAFGLGLNLIGAFENNAQKLLPNETINEWQFSATIGMLVLDTLIYIGLGVYVDAVLPASWRGFGVPRPWYFCVSPRFWMGVCGSAPPPPSPAAGDGCCGAALPCWRKPRLATVGGAGALDAADASFFEEPDANLRALRAGHRCVTTERLRKEFATPDGPKLAVNNVNLDMFEGQISVLLGPNGAGKTTTISMLTGLIEPSGGSTSFFGAAHGSVEARRSLGVCPQHDVLWADLTVREHLETFAVIKGAPSNAVAGEVDKIIREVGLTEKVNVLSKALSGGMKRKLSVAIALIAGSKVVFLDEPTSGMDPYSRRSTWNILQNARAGRVILLTTHFMDEADILGDRVAIMGGGQVKCAGTPLFLKKRYGVGYLLSLVKTPGGGSGANAGATLEVLRRHVPAASLASNVAGELRVRLPLSASAAFPDMLAELDRSLGALGFVSYGMSVTSIEDVFLKIAEASVAGTAPSGAGPNAVEIEMPIAVRKISTDAVASDKVAGAAAGGVGGDSLDAVRGLARAEATGAATFFLHLRALFLKRLQYAKRDWRAVCYQVLLPGFLIALGLALILVGNNLGNPSKLLLSVSAFNRGVPPVVAPSFSFKTNGGEAAFSQNATAAMGLMDVSAADSKKLTQSEANAIPDYADGAGLPLSTNATVPVRFSSLASPQREYQQMSVFLLNNRLSRAVSTYGAVVWEYANTSFQAADDPSALPPVRNAGASVALFVNTTGLDTPAVWLNQLDSALLRGVHASGAPIKTSNWPLPRTFRQKTLFNGLFVFVASLIIIIAFAYVASNTALFIVKEREVSAKHQQIISGVSITAYWVANFIFDYCAYLLPAVIAIILCRIFNIQEFMSPAASRLPALLLNFFLFGFASITSTYILCFIFKNPASAQSAVLFINVFSIILIATSQFLSQIGDTCQAERSIRYLFALLPSYPFGVNLVSLSFLSQLPIIEATCDGGRVTGAVTADALEWRACGAMLLYMAMQSVVYAGVILAIEVVVAKPALRQKLWADPRKPLEPCDEDADVVREAARVTEQRVRGAGALSDAILISRLRKVYGTGKTAVRDLSFGVPPGEVFGFLGINGAGKTTTLQMLTGDVLPTSGTASLAGYDILSQQPQVRRLLGYCPQFDSLLELLTVKEHLELFARIKGVAEKDLAAVVRQKVAELDLGSFVNKTAGSLSGGNKRKLCVAIALIGNPPLVFLDEPCKL